MREYQPKKNNPYRLPQNLYNEVKYIIKDYKRLKEEYTALTEAPEAERNWVRLCSAGAKISAVNRAIEEIPPEYRVGVMNNMENERSRDGYYPDNADYRTYQTYKRRLIFHVAKNMNYV
ncbi:MAG: hypothetical protein IKP71_09510 [Candidatus Riflebacteria bacterium]|nr:hypothetical protein [Candidatus Riflebacteria bacterium]